MALQLSARAELLLAQTNVQQQIILEIEGIDTIYGALVVGKIARYGDAIVFGDVGLVYGGITAHPDQKDYISLSNTTKTITQQLEQDKGGTGSISSMKINLVDNNEELTVLFSSLEMLGRKSFAYLAFNGGAHPEDSVRIFSGTIDTISFDAGSVNLTIAHPEQLKRQKIFQNVKTALTSNIDNSVTTIPIDTTLQFISPGDSVKTYIRVNDEIIRYTGTTTTTLTGCTRAQLNTLASAHETGDDIETFYRLEGNCIDLALKMMISGSGTYASEIDILSFQIQDASTTIPNAMFFSNANFKDRYGLVEGDFVTVTGATNGSNNISGRTITDFGTFDNGSYIVVSGAPLVNESITSAVIALSSKYDVLPNGTSCAMSPEQVDVARHEELDQLFGAGFHTYDFYIKDTIEAKKFIEESIYFPSNLYQLPRQGRASLGITNPPLALEDVPSITLSEVTNASSINISRSINKNFYNAVVYKVDLDSIEDKFLSGDITLSTDSTATIPVGTRPLVIEAGGVRAGVGTALLQTQARRFLDRYKFAAENLMVDVLYKIGFKVEVGDIVLFGGPSLKITDIKTGSRDFEPRLMEVTNKSLNIKDGKVRLQLTDTAFSIDGRFGTFSPSSIVGTGSSTTEIITITSFGNESTEKKKWNNYIGLTIRVRKTDYSQTSTAVFIEFDDVNVNKMLLASALSFTPVAGDIIDVPDYNIQEETYKRIHTSFNPTVGVTGGSSGTVFTVDTPSQIVAGQPVLIRNTDWTILSTESNVVSVVGFTITVDTDLGLTPASGQKVELIGFIDDDGSPARFI